MQRSSVLLLISVLAVTPTVAQARMVPFHHGDELFKIAGAPQYSQGFSLGYKCQDVSVLGADLWTWDCQLSAVKVEDSTYADIPQEDVATYEKVYSPSDRVRNPWNHYGGFLIVGGLGFGAYRTSMASNHCMRGEFKEFLLL